MIFDNKEDFIKKCGSDTKLLGLDIGSKTIGVAVCDYTRIIATPLETIKRNKFTTDLKVLMEIIQENQIAGIVVGLPLNSNGGENPTSQSIRQFVRNFLKEHEMAFFWWDERYSSIAAERALLEADMSREKRSKVIDKIAASYILQGFLDSI